MFMQPHVKVESAKEYDELCQGAERVKKHENNHAYEGGYGRK